MTNHERALHGMVYQLEVLCQGTSSLVAKAADFGAPALELTEKREPVL
jgi:hypothetical protein